MPKRGLIQNELKFFKKYIKVNQQGLKQIIIQESLSMSYCY